MIDRREHLRILECRYADRPFRGCLSACVRSCDLETLRPRQPRDVADAERRWQGLIIGDDRFSEAGDGDDDGGAEAMRARPSDPETRIARG
jgi:hypothetical protein